MLKSCHWVFHHHHRSRVYGASYVPDTSIEKLRQNQISRFESQNSHRAIILCWMHNFLETVPQLLINHAQGDGEAATSERPRNPLTLKASPAQWGSGGVDQDDMKRSVSRYIHTHVKNCSSYKRQPIELYHAGYIS